VSLVRRDVSNRAVPMLVLYQLTNRVTHARAALQLTKGRRGYAGVCLSVRNSASEYWLSLHTCGRLNEGTMPSHCTVAI
jgi:hypothetical protein